LTFVRQNTFDVSIFDMSNCARVPVFGFHGGLK
jgi:hypothetical protein